METPVVDETIISGFVKDFGDKIQQSVFMELYSSPFGKVLLCICAFVAIFSIGLAIHSKKVPRKSIWFLFAVIIAFPVNGVPLGYRAVNGVGVFVASLFESSVLKAVGNSSSPSGANSNTPPGQVMELVAAAATSKVTDQNVRNNLVMFIKRCLSAGLRNDNSPMQFDDIFNFRTEYDHGFDGVVTPVFIDSVINKASLRNTNFDSKIDCANQLDRVRYLFREHLNKKSLNLVNRKIAGGGFNGKVDPGIFRTWDDHWKIQNPKMYSFVLNLQTAAAAEREKSNVDYPWTMSAGAGYIIPSVDASVAMLDSLTAEMSYGKNTFAERYGSAWFENRGHWEFGELCAELRTKIEMLPFDIAAIQLLLKALAPIAFLSLLFGTARFALAWSVGWVVTCFYPSIATMLRSVTNSFLASLLNLNNIIDGDVPGLTKSYASLAYGVDLDLAKSMMVDFAPQANSMMTLELKILGALAALAIAGGLWAGSYANKGMNNSINYLASMLIFRGAGSLVKSPTPGGNPGNPTSQSQPSGTYNPGGGQPGGLTEAPIKITSRELFADKLLEPTRKI